MKFKLPIVLALLVFASSQVNLTNRAYLTEVMDNKSVTDVLKDLDSFDVVKLPFERTELVIDSPGGSVAAGELLINLSRRRVPLDTYIPKYAASMAADTFLLGEHRIMGKDATILFHQARVIIPVGFFFGIVITATDIDSLIKNKSFPLNTSDANKDFEAALRKVNKWDTFLDSFKKEFPKMLESLNRIDRDQIIFIMKRTGLSEKVVREKVVIPNVDTVLTAQQALKLNIATKIQG